MWFVMCARVQREGKDECGCAMCAHVLSMQRGEFCVVSTRSCVGGLEERASCGIEGKSQGEDINLS